MATAKINGNSNNIQTNGEIKWPISLPQFNLEEIWKWSNSRWKINSFNSWRLYLDWSINFFFLKIYCLVAEIGVNNGITSNTISVNFLKVKTIRNPYYGCASLVVIADFWARPYSLGCQKWLTYLTFIGCFTAYSLKLSINGLQSQIGFIFIFFQLAFYFSQFQKKLSLLNSSKTWFILISQNSAQSEHSSPIKNKTPWQTPVQWLQSFWFLKATPYQFFLRASLQRIFLKFCQW